MERTIVVLVFVLDANVNKERDESINNVVLVTVSYNKELRRKCEVKQGMFE